MLERFRHIPKTEIIRQTASNILRPTLPEVASYHRYVFPFERTMRGLVLPIPGMYWMVAQRMYGLEPVIYFLENHVWEVLGTSAAITLGMTIYQLRFHRQNTNDLPKGMV
ncbi:MAG: hypothetical protein AAB414_01890 [Patescibacteria group bacterium]